MNVTKKKTKKDKQTNANRETKERDINRRNIQKDRSR
jgi:hypothetical protein